MTTPSTTRSEELKPCPFCGGCKFNVCRTAYLDTEAFAVSCLTPECHGAVYALGYGHFPTEAEAIAAWNQRTLTPDDALREALECSVGKGEFYVNGDTFDLVFRPGGGSMSSLDKVVGRFACGETAYTLPQIVAQLLNAALASTRCGVSG